MEKIEEKRYLKWYNKVGYGSGDVAGNVVYAFLSTFVMIYLTNTVGLNAVIANCSEYTYMTKKKRVDGTMYSCTSLGIKLGGGIGTAITGWLLEFSKFDKNLDVQLDSCLNMLHIMYLWIPFIICIVITLIMSQMNVEKANQQLRAKRN